MRLSSPWPEGYNINARSPYGPRKHPITGKRTFHHGVDVALPVGTPLTAPADGVVVKKGNGPSGGVTLIVKHDNNLHTVYYHLQKPSHLAVGAQVKRGDLIAYSGNTGASTGPHLHMELRRSARWGDTIDPMPYLEAAPVKTKPVFEPAPKPKRRIPTPLSPKLASFFQMRKHLR
jgi:murein DD-endopeptidase MepM/ murein hydrolase activator NlpD